MAYTPNSYTYTNTPPTVTSGSQVVPQADAAGSLYVDGEQRLATYSITKTISPAASPTDIFTLAGSATKIIKLRRVRITGSATTAGLALVDLATRVTANTGGTSTTGSGISLATGLATSSAQWTLYSVNPSALGSASGVLETLAIPLTTTAAPLYNNVLTTYGADGVGPIILNGTANLFVLFLNSLAQPMGTSYTMSFTWTEE